MDISPYTKYVRSMVEHGERRITEINWLFESVEKSLARAETNFIAEKKSTSLHFSTSRKKSDRFSSKIFRRHTRSEAYEAFR